MYIVDNKVDIFQLKCLLVVFAEVLLALKDQFHFTGQC